MHVKVNGTSLWYDIEGSSGPTLILIHGGPASYDHSYFRPWFSRLADRMRIVYLDLREHGLDRLAGGFRRVAGDEVGELARRAYSVDDVPDEEWARVFEAFGPNRPSSEALARRVQNPELAPHGGVLLQRLDLLDQLPRITSPTLVSVGDLDPLMLEPVGELMAGLSAGIGRLEVIPGAGHFAWLDDPDRYFGSIEDFVTR